MFYEVNAMIPFARFLMLAVRALPEQVKVWAAGRSGCRSLTHSASVSLVRDRLSGWCANARMAAPHRQMAHSMLPPPTLRVDRANIVKRFSHDRSALERQRGVLATAAHPPRERPRQPKRRGRNELLLIPVSLHTWEFCKCSFHSCSLISPAERGA